MFRKLLLILVCTLGFSSNALAHHSYIPTVTFGGYVDTQLGFRDQKKNCEFPAIIAWTTCGKKYNDFAIVNDTKINLNFDGETIFGLHYGGQITINADSTNNKTNHLTVSKHNNTEGYYVFSYLELHQVGRLEMGSTTGALEKLKINAGTESRATGGVSGDWRYWINPEIMASAPTKASFVLTPDLPTNADTGGEDRAAKVTYYSPDWYGFNMAVTYIPDTEQHGSVALTHTTLSAFTTNTPAFRNGRYKDVVSGGVNYNYDDGFYRLGISTVGEIGNAKNVTSTIKREALGAYEVGLKVGIDAITIVGSYGNWSKSGQTKGLSGKQDASFWDAGINYSLEGFGISLGYFDSKKGNGKSKRATLSNISLGIDYNMLPGFKPYIEASHFEMSQKAHSMNGKNSGNIVLAGAKVVF